MKKNLLMKSRSFEEEQKKLLVEEEYPAYHMTGVSGWINDPNGFSYYKGEYHLFYQYHPYENKWGQIHWGHAKSKDFITWERLPIAIAPDQEFDEEGCFSGSALELEDGRQFLMYTGVQEKITETGEKKLIQAQCVAWGDGIDYEKYAQNPVIAKEDLPDGANETEFRDPKVWFEDGRFYVVTVNQIENGAVLLYESEDMIHWKYCGILDSSRGELGTMWECPDFFSLDEKQVLIVSPMHMKPNGEDFHPGHGTVCRIGHYDKVNFKFYKEEQHLLDYGIDFYAPQTMETPDHRRIMIAWMQAWSTSAFVPEGAKYFGQMTVPRELSIKNGKVYQTPVRELEAYRKDKLVYSNVTVSGETSFAKLDGRILDMTVEIKDVKQFHEFSISVACNEEYETNIIYQPEKHQLCVDRTNSGFLYDIIHTRSITVHSVDNKLKLRILLDKFSMELFINDGEKAASFVLYTPQTATGIKFFSDSKVLVDIEKYTLL